jgi:hypothetical protein
MDWKPQLITPNRFGRDALLERGFDPLNDIPEGLGAPLLDDVWGVWILRQQDGERIRRSMDQGNWQTALDNFSRGELAAQPFAIAMENLNDGEVAKLYQFVKTHHLVALDHLAAVRAILSLDGSWIWCIGICHDEILYRSGDHRLLARYRNQRTFLPRIEFEPGVDLVKALASLLDQGFERSDIVDIEGEVIRGIGIGDVLSQLGV